MAHSSVQLHKATVLKALPPRRDPYWGPPLAKGRHIGYRKLDAARGTWIARFRLEAGGLRYHSLGAATADFGVEQAQAAAKEWFESMEVTPTAAATKAYTVEWACRRYVDERTLNASPATGHEAFMRFNRTVFNSDFAALPLARITSAAILHWRSGLKQRPMTANRTVTCLKAALNLAVRERRLSAAKTIEWSSVKQLDYVHMRRNTYLDLEQRRQFLAACGDGAFHDFMLAAIVTGARPGEITKAKRSQFDARQRTMTFIGKTSRKVVPRTVPISADAVKLFEKRAKGLNPDDLLFTRDDGAAWAHSSWDEMVKGAVLAARLPKDTVLYTFRHSWITQAIMGGMNTFDAAKLTGTSLLMIEKHYGHLVNGAARLSLDSIPLI